jgi:hypothetical protein
MHFSQIQTIKDFNHYMTDCQVIPRSKNPRFGKVGESSHSMQSLVFKLQSLVREVQLLPSPSIGIAIDGKIVVQAGLSECDEKAIYDNVNGLLTIARKLDDLQMFALLMKPKGLKAKISRLVTRIALRCRYGHQPTTSKLLSQIAVAVENKFRQEIRNNERNRELMREAKILIGSSLNKLKSAAAEAFSSKNAIQIHTEIDQTQEESSSSEESFRELLEIPEPPKDEATKPVIRPTSQLLQAGKDKIYNQRKSKRQSKRPAPKPSTNRPNSIMLRSQKDTLKALDNAAKQVRSPQRTGWESVIGGVMDDRRSRIKDSSPTDEDNFSFTASSSSSWSAEVPE